LVLPIVNALKLVQLSFCPLFFNTNNNLHQSVSYMFSNNSTITHLSFSFLADVYRISSDGLARHESLLLAERTFCQNCSEAPEKKPTPLVFSHV